MIITYIIKTYFKLYLLDAFTTFVNNLAVNLWTLKRIKIYKSIKTNEDNFLEIVVTIYCTITLNTKEHSAINLNGMLFARAILVPN